jgi:hypothetical protein
MPGGEAQKPGDWNRIALKVADLPACIAALKAPECVFATTWKPVLADGRSKSRILTGNPIELSNQVPDDYPRADNSRHATARQPGTRFSTNLHDRRRCPPASGNRIVRPVGPHVEREVRVLW